MTGKRGAAEEETGDGIGQIHSRNLCLEGLIEEYSNDTPLLIMLHSSVVQVCNLDLCALIFRELETVTYELAYGTSRPWYHLSGLRSLFTHTK